MLTNSIPLRKWLDCCVLGVGKRIKYVQQWNLIHDRSMRDCDLASLLHRVVMISGYCGSATLSLEEGRSTNLTNKCTGLQQDKPFYC